MKKAARTMLKKEQLHFAEAYVALSNAHQVDQIRCMLTEQAEYSSSTVGEFKGRQAICNMMLDFFAKFPDVHWQVPAYHNVDDNIVEFSFTMTATELQSGTAIVRHGTERIGFSAALIDRIIVIANASVAESGKTLSE